MARPANPVPPLKYHAPTRQFCAYHRGRRITFGQDRTAAQAAYRIWITQLLAANREPTAIPVAGEPIPALTVAEALEHYLTYAATRYNANHLARIQEAVKQCVAARPRGPGGREVAAAIPVGEELASAFRARMLLVVREHLLHQTIRAKRATHGLPLSRSNINAQIDCIQRAWRWLTTQELVPSENLASVLAVKSLTAGEGGREPKRVMPAPIEAVEAAIAAAPPVLRGMLRVQFHSSARPGEVCRMRRCDISTDPGEKVLLPGCEYPVSAFDMDDVRVWVYVPESHKTLWKGKPRVVLLGPKAQEALRPFFEGRSPGDYLFSPAAATTIHRTEQRAARKSKVQPSQKNRKKKRPRKTPGTHYDSGSYRRALDALLGRINADRASQVPPLPPIPLFRPNQIRHLGLTSTAERFDEATAAAVAGHAGTDAIRHYVKMLIAKAGRAAAELG